MAERQLKPETQAAIREAAERITDEHGLPAETREELASHLEEKALAYVGGEEPLSEADALVLAKHHLGDTQVLGAQLARVSPRLMLFRRPLFKRLAVAALALLVARAMASFMYVLVYLPFLVTHPMRRAIERQSMFDRSASTYANILTLLTACVLFPLMLGLSGRVLRRDLSLRTLVLMVVGALVLNVFAVSLPGIQDAMSRAPNALVERYYLSIPNVHYIHWSAGVLTPLIMLGLWLRFCCEKVKTTQTVFVASSIWFFVTALLYFAVDYGRAIEMFTAIGPVVDHPKSIRQILWLLEGFAYSAAHSSARSIVISMTIQMPIALLLAGCLPWWERRSQSSTSALAAP